MVERTFPGLGEVASSIRKNFRCFFGVRHIDFDFSGFFNEKRKQYDAEAILKKIKRQAPLEADKTIFVVRKDLYADGLSFIFGISEKKECIVSIARLDPRFYGDTENPSEANELFKERIRKEILHELGHTMGLKHCPDRKCVMVLSNSIKDVDFKSDEFCKKCIEKLEKN